MPEVFFLVFVEDGAGVIDEGRDVGEDFFGFFSIGLCLCLGYAADDGAGNDAD